jgi:hypothetical protein
MRMHLPSLPGRAGTGRRETNAGLMEWRSGDRGKRRAGRALRCSSAKVVAHWIRCKFECSMWLDEGPRKRFANDAGLTRAANRRDSLAAMSFASKMFLGCSTQVEAMFDAWRRRASATGDVSQCGVPGNNNQFVGACLYVDSR